MLSISLIWIVSYLLAIQRLTADVSYFETSPNKNNKIKVPSIQSQICSFFGLKVSVYLLLFYLFFYFFHHF
jgi:hypothetical protein